MENHFDFITKELRNRIDHPIIGESSKIHTVLELIYKAAQAVSTPVMITGESGTGKELVALGIHYLSKRNNYTFCAVNCFSLPSNLLETELFGYIKGSFTDAKNDHLGLFETAHRGTLFLDEIGDLPLDFQAKILRTIENHKIRKVGAVKEISVDVRIISATNKDIDKLVQEKQFRLDLYHRINTLMIHIPPLRERPEDIPMLIDYYVGHFSESMNKKINSVDFHFIDTLLNYNFPGNVRELKNIVERSVIYCDNGILEYPMMTCRKSYEKLSECDCLNKDCPYSDIEQPRRFHLNLMEEHLLRSAMKKTGNNKTKASELLNISWSALHRKLKKYHIIS